MNHSEARMGLGALLAAGVTLVVTGVVLAFGQQVSGEVKDDMGTTDCAARSDGYTNYNTTSDLCYNGSGTTSQVGTYGHNTTIKAQAGTDNVSKKLPTVGLIVAAVVIIGLLIKGFTSN